MSIQSILRDARSALFQITMGRVKSTLKTWLARLAQRYCGCPICRAKAMSQTGWMQGERAVIYWHWRKWKVRQAELGNLARMDTTSQTTSSPLSLSENSLTRTFPQ